MACNERVGWGAKGDPFEVQREKARGGEPVETGKASEKTIVEATVCVRSVVAAESGEKLAIGQRAHQRRESEEGRQGGKYVNTSMDLID